MIQIIHGENGTGKTKKIIAQANKIADSIKGSTVFIDTDNSYMYDLGYSIRFINYAEYSLVPGAEAFLGFIGGLCASDYDLEYVFADSFLDIIGTSSESLGGFFSALSEFTEKHKLNVVLSVNEKKEQLPAFMQQYIAD